LCGCCAVWCVWVPVSVSVCVCVCVHACVCFCVCVCVHTAALAFSLAASAHAPRMMTGPSQVQNTTLQRPPNGPTLMPLIRQIQTSALMPTGNPHATLMQQSPETGIIYAPYDYPYTLAPGTSILEYPIDTSGVLGKCVCACVHDFVCVGVG